MLNQVHCSEHDQEYYSVFQIPGLSVDFYQYNKSQCISSDTQILCNVVFNYLLSHQVSNILDMGTGNGILLLMLAKDYPDLRYVGIEIINELKELAIMNFIQLSNLFKKQFNYSIIQDNYAQINFQNEKFDLIVSNPPYYKKNSGRLSPFHEKNISRFEIEATQSDLLVSVKNNLASDGTAFVLYPVTRQNEIIETCKMLKLNCQINKDLFSRLGSHDRISIFELSHA